MIGFSKFNIAFPFDYYFLDVEDFNYIITEQKVL